MSGKMEQRPALPRPAVASSLHSPRAELRWRRGAARALRQALRARQEAPPPGSPDGAASGPTDAAGPGPGAEGGPPAPPPPAASAFASAAARPFSTGPGPEHPAPQPDAGAPAHPAGLPHSSWFVRASLREASGEEHAPGDGARRTPWPATAVSWAAGREGLLAGDARAPPVTWALLGASWLISLGA